MMAGQPEPIRPLADAVTRATTELRRLDDTPSDRSNYYLGLMTAATETAIAGYEAGDEANLRIGLRLLLSYNAAAVFANARSTS